MSSQCGFMSESTRSATLSLRGRIRLTFSRTIAIPPAFVWYFCANCSASSGVTSRPRPNFFTLLRQMERRWRDPSLSKRIE